MKPRPEYSLFLAGWPWQPWSTMWDSLAHQVRTDRTTSRLSSCRALITVPHKQMWVSGAVLRLLLGKEVTPGLVKAHIPVSPEAQHTDVCAGVHEHPALPQQPSQHE